MNLYDRLTEYSKRDYYPMHMPGHKRNKELIRMVDPYSIDITEIEGFDNLHHAQGVLLKGMERAARLYGADHTNYLVGGSTAGILTGISACTKKGDRILVARNSHKSVYHAIYLKELNPVYIYPQQLPEYGINGGISPAEIEKMLIKYPDIKLVMITSPTYEGILSEVKAIADIAHRYNIPLMVDEAHGAHLGFHPGFPAGSVTLGADIVIHSIHKTLPAFTQSALIHINGSLVDYEEVKRYLSIYQSTSPSYVLMAGIDKCISLLEQQKEELFSNFNEQLQFFYIRMEKLAHMKILTRKRVKEYGFYDFDPSKITISVRGTALTGNELYNRLLETYRIQMEMVSGDYVLGMTSIGDTKEGFKRLGDALLELDRKCGEELLKSRKTSDKNIDRNDYSKKHVKDRSFVTCDKLEGENISNSSVSGFTQTERVMLCHEAYEKPQERILLQISEGRVSAEYLYLYPPGIPLLVPGEKISASLLAEILTYQKDGLSLQGLADMEGKYIKVVAASNEERVGI